MALDLTVLEPGHALGRAGETLEVRKDGEVLERVPLHRIFSLTVGQGVSLSTDLLSGLADHGVPVLVQDRSDRPAAMLVSPHGWGGAPLRRSQALAGAAGLGHPIAQELIRAKILHQSRLAALWSGYLPPGEQRRRLEGLSGDLAALAPLTASLLDAPHLMALEGQASRLHWAALSVMVPFRERRYPQAPDLMNRLLNYGYGVLGRTWTTVVLRAGLDPHLGVLHADRIGRPGLVLDLLEPWRPWVDRTIAGLIRQRVPLETCHDGLALATRRRLLDALHRAFSSAPPRHRQPLRALWLANTRQLARHLHRGEPWRPLLLQP